jgi:hypothetical protein
MQPHFSAETLRLDNQYVWISTDKKGQTDRETDDRYQRVNNKKKEKGETRVSTWHHEAAGMGSVVWLVEMRGFEPLASALRTLRSPN